LNDLTLSIRDSARLAKLSRRCWAFGCIGGGDDMVTDIFSRFHFTFYVISASPKLFILCEIFFSINFATNRLFTLACQFAFKVLLLTATNLLNNNI
jgi:hypothetical protein